MYMFPLVIAIDRMTTPVMPSAIETRLCPQSLQPEFTRCRQRLCASLAMRGSADMQNLAGADPVARPRRPD